MLERVACLCGWQITMPWYAILLIILHLYWQSKKKAQFEVIARNEYTKSDEKNPIDCSLFYLALKKKAVLQGLWRMAAWNKEQSATIRLLSNNFQDPKWKTAAMKNAYALLGKRRHGKQTNLDLPKAADDVIRIRCSVFLTCRLSKRCYWCHTKSTQRPPACNCRYKGVRRRKRTSS